MQKKLDLFRVSEIEITYKNKVPYADRLLIDTAKRAYDAFMSVWPNTIELREEFRIMLLDQKCHCLGISSIAAGGLTSCDVDPKLVFATALKGKATSIILAHNHPSGFLEPSQADIAVTQQLMDSGELLRLPIFDHLILTREGFYSFARDGILPVRSTKKQAHLRY